MIITGLVAISDRIALLSPPGAVPRQLGPFLEGTQLAWKIEEALNRVTLPRKSGRPPSEMDRNVAGLCEPLPGGARSLALRVEC